MKILLVESDFAVRDIIEQMLVENLGDIEFAYEFDWDEAFTLYCRRGPYDLVITDVDMPRMDGIELATLIKKDPLLKSLPVMIVSYKDRDEDRLRGLEAGADYYLTKGSFHDETLLQAVVDLIGESDS